MNATAERDEAGANQQAESGRDGKGRFTKGNGGGPGNPFARKVAELRTTLVNFVTEDDMKHVAFVLKEKAMGGDLEAIKLLFQYVLGKPAETVDPDRLDVDEWQKMQEQSRPPAEVQQVMGGLPAQTICDMTRISWPCAVEQALGTPMREGLRAMDERDARREAKARQQPEGQRPSANRANGEESSGPRGLMGEAMARVGASVQEDGSPSVTKRRKRRRGKKRRRGRR